MYKVKFFLRQLVILAMGKRYLSKTWY